MEQDAATANRTCPWCSAPAALEATQCGACGAALAQRESIGDLVIPGVTDVDPALRAYDAQPLHIPRSSPTQGLAGGAVVAAAAAGGPLGLVVLGGLAAVAATEYAGAGGERRDAGQGEVGRPSEAVLRALERLSDGVDPPATLSADSVDAGS